MFFDNYVHTSSCAQANGSASDSSSVKPFSDAKANNSYILATGNVGAPGGQAPIRTFTINAPQPCAAGSQPTLQIAPTSAFAYGSSGGLDRTIRDFNVSVLSISNYDAGNHQYTVKFWNSVQGKTPTGNSDTGANASIAWTLYCMR